MAERKAKPEPKASDAAVPSIESATAAINAELPVVEAPKLGAGATPSEAADASGGEVVSGPAPAAGGAAQSEAADASAGEPAAAAAPASIATAASTPASSAAAAPAPAAADARSSRFTLLAATLALAAALGAVAGSLSASAIAHLWPAAAAARENVADAGAAPALKAELSAFKASLDAAGRNSGSQFAKLAERLDRVEHAQIDPTLKLAQIAAAIDRLEKRSAAAPETTGSIAPATPSAAADAKPSERILQDWVVEDVRGNRALVESRYGGVFTVTSGSTLPGLGHVEAIKRQDGGWIVVTERGLITSGR